MRVRIDTRKTEVKNKLYILALGFTSDPYQLGLSVQLFLSVIFMNDLIAVQHDSVKTMSSREIAEIMGKQHNHVMRDIRDMLDKLNNPDLDYQQNQGVMAETCPQTKRTACYHLDRYHTEVLITGYDVKRRAAVIKRWYELESGAAQPVHQREQDSDLLQKLKAMSYLHSELNVTGSGKLDLVRRFVSENEPSLLSALPNYAVDAPVVDGQAQAASSEATSSLTALLKEKNYKETAVTVNKRLECAGILERKQRRGANGGVRHYWSITDTGLAYGKNITSPNAQRETQPHWYVSRFDELMGFISLR